MTEHQNDPLRAVLDLAFYAPLGLFLAVQKEIPKLAEAGRHRVTQQVTLARFVGKFAVDKATKTVKQRVAPTATPAPQPAAAPVVPAPTEHSAPTTSDGGSPDALAIEGYDSLAASQIVARLASLTDAERASIRAYEAANRARRTVLGKLDQLDAA